MTRKASLVASIWAERNRLNQRFQLPQNMNVFATLVDEIDASDNLASLETLPYFNHHIGHIPQFNTSLRKTGLPFYQEMIAAFEKLLAGWDELIEMCGDDEAEDYMVNGYSGVVVCELVDGEEF